jgi:DNA polymerase-3 subunit gamma/tau
MEAPDLSRNLKPKTTLSLQSLLKPAAAKAQEQLPPELAVREINEPVVPQHLRTVWDEFAETRKNQVAEYQILKREYSYKHPAVLVTLTNPVEETLLENFRRDLIQFLRDRLKNAEITLTVELKEATGKKVLYTSKEKFEHLAEKNPYLNELKERLGLDWDF